MNLAALYSGGKDSTFATYLMEQQGHEIEFLISIIPDNTYSWMFHTPNLNLIPAMAEAMDKKYIGIESHGEEKEEPEDICRYVLILFSRNMLQTQLQN